MATLGEQLTYWRKKRHLTRCELATLMNMKVYHLRGIELGKHKYPREETLQQFERTLGVRIEVTVKENLR